MPTQGRHSLDLGEWIAWQYPEDRLRLLYRESPARYGCIEVADRLISDRILEVNTFEDAVEFVRVPGFIGEPDMLPFTISVTRYDPQMEAVPLPGGGYRRNATLRIETFLDHNPGLNIGEFSTRALEIIFGTRNPAIVLDRHYLHERRGTFDYSNIPIMTYEFNSYPSGEIGPINFGTFFPREPEPLYDKPTEREFEVD